MKMWTKSICDASLSEIQCIIFQQNNVNTYEFNSNYIELSIVFLTMINSSGI